VLHGVRNNNSNDRRTMASPAVPQVSIINFKVFPCPTSPMQY
jgi:hypothetical protein